MLIKLNNTRWLTRDFTTPEAERSSALRPLVSGRRSLRIAQLLGAEHAIPVNAGNATLRLEFTVEELHASAAEAQAALLTALEGTAEGHADLYCGEPECGYTLVRLENAVLSALEESHACGVRSRIRYRLEAARAELQGNLPPGTETPEETALSASNFAAIDAGRHGYQPGFNAPESGTLDGGHYTDALLPSALTLDFA